MPSSRNPAVSEVLGYLEDLDFQTHEESGMWVARRTSGMLRRVIVLPDDPAVSGDLIYGSFWQQTMEIHDEIEDYLQSLADDGSADDEAE